MKKILAVLLALCVVASFASAQITFSGHGKVKATYANDALSYGDEIRLNFAGTSEDKNFGVRGRIQLSTTGKTTTATFEDDTLLPVDTNTTNDVFSVAGTDLSVPYMYGFANFFDGMFKITAGKLYNFDYYWGSNGSNNQVGNVSFNLWYGYAAKAVLFQVYPVEGLTLALRVKPAAAAIDATIFAPAVSYDIKDIGTVMAYMVPATDFAQSEVGAAFALSAVENLTFDIGYVGLASHTIMALAGYTAGDLYAEVSGQYVFDASFYVEGTVEYSLANGMAIRAFGGYDGDQSVLGADYIVGGELNIPMGKGEINLGVNYSDSLSLPLYIKYAF